MDVEVLNPTTDAVPTTASQNRARLRDAGVFAVNVIGGPGAGKTSLIRATLESLVLQVRGGVITPDPGRDAGRLRWHADQVVRVKPGAENLLTTAAVRTAIDHLDLGRLDTLLIENVDSLTGPASVDLGQSAVACVFSVAAGDDNAARYAQAVRAADVVVLNKADLFTLVPFDRAAFRADVARINPAATLVEVSTLTGAGMAAWLEWVLRRAPRPGGRTALW